MAVKGDLYIEGLAEIRKELRALEPDVKKAAAKRGREIADYVAQQTSSAAATSAERKSAVTIKRIGASGVKAGGPGAAGNMFFGTEFGGRGRRSTQQFRPHRGKQGYYFWQTIRRQSKVILSMWEQVLDDVLPNRAPRG